MDAALDVGCGAGAPLAGLVVVSDGGGADGGVLVPHAVRRAVRDGYTVVLVAAAECADHYTAVLRKLGAPASPPALTIVDLSDDDALWTEPDGLAVASSAIAAAVAASPVPPAATALIFDSLAALADASRGDITSFRRFLATAVLACGCGLVVARTDGGGGEGAAGAWRADLAACASLAVAYDPVGGGGGGGGGGDVAAVLTARRRCEAAWGGGEGGGDDAAPPAGPLAGRWNVRVVDAAVRLAERPL